MDRIKALKRVINRYAQALVNDTWKGQYLPDDWIEIEEELRRATEALNNALKKHVKRNPKKPSH